MTLPAASLLSTAPELTRYQDEPGQMRSGMPGKAGALRLGFERRGDRSALVDLYRRAPLLVQKALYWDDELPGMPCVFMIHTSGSVLQGDRFDIEIRVGDGAQAHVTNQAATKIHEMEANFAAQDVVIELGEDAYLEYLPGVMIPHKHARFVGRLTMTVPASATVIAGDVLMPGRKYHGEGELFEYDVFSSTVSARRPDGTPLFTEKLLVEPGRSPVRDVAVMGGYDVLGTVMVVTSPEAATAILAQTPAVFGPELASGASRLPNDAGLIFRVLGMETDPVRAAVRTFWDVVRRTVVGVAVPPEFLWR
jgi:urease accessory protein